MSRSVRRVAAFRRGLETVCGRTLTGAVSVARASISVTFKMQPVFTLSLDQGTYVQKWQGATVARAFTPHRRSGQPVTDAFPPSNCQLSARYIF